MKTIPSALAKGVAILLLFFLVISGLYFAKEFLVPVAFAGILSMLFLPLCRRFESKGMNRAWASILCILIFLIVLAGIVALISWQISDLAEDTAKMQDRITKTGDQLKRFVSNTIGISKKQQQQMMEEKSHHLQAM